MKDLKRVVFLAFCTILLSGCASMSASKTDRQAANDSGESVGLYEGEPEVVFATQFPVASAEEANARADHAFSEDDKDLALYMYVRAFDLDKDNVHALMRIGEIHQSRSNDQLAARAYVSVLRIDPANSAALQSLGLIYLQTKRHEEAKALLESAVAVEPALWRAQNGIGIIADMQGDHETAIRAYDAALEARPGDSSLMNNRGYSRYLAGKYADAEKDFLAAAAQGSDRAWLNLGLVRARQERYSEAVRLMVRTVESAVAYNDVGYIAMRQGDLAVAERYFQKAIRVSPRYFKAAQDNLAELREQRMAEADIEPQVMSHAVE